MEKVKTIKTEFILNKIESAKEKLKKNNNDHYELINILEIFNFFSIMKIMIILTSIVYF